MAYTAWCGPCNNSGFARGLSTNAGGTWHAVPLPANFPNRFIGGVGIDPTNAKHAYVAVNGFSRRFTEGPGVGLGHLWETTDGGSTWADASALMTPLFAVLRVVNVAPQVQLTVVST